MEQRHAVKLQILGGLQNLVALPLDDNTCLAQSRIIHTFY